LREGRPLPYEKITLCGGRGNPAPTVEYEMHT